MTDAPKTDDTPPDPKPAAPKPADGFKSAADIKAWVRRELHFHACGLAEDERQSRNP